MADCYRKLDAVLAFTKCAKGIHAYESPIYIKAAFSTQVAYPAIDIMMESLPSIRNFKVESLQKDVGVFDILSGSIGGIPVLIEFGNQIDPAIPDSNMMMMHHFSYVYHGGTLSLENTYGPVTWKPRIMVSGTTGNTMEAKLCNLLTDEAEVPAKDFFEDKLIRAIEKELLETAQEIEQGPSTVQVQKGILCAKVWTEMTKVFGYARMKPFNSSNSVNMELITNILEGDKE